MSVLGCFDASEEMTLKGAGRGVSLAGSAADGRIDVATGIETPGRIISSKAAAERAVRYVDRALERNLRVLVGVTYTGQDASTDRIGTRHFLTIIGRSFEPTGPNLLFGLVKAPERIVYYYLDPAFTAITRDNGAIGKLYIDDASGILFKPGVRRAAGMLGKDYQVTHVRLYKNPAIPTD